MAQTVTTAPAPNHSQDGKMPPPLRNPQPPALEGADRRTAHRQAGRVNP